MKILPIALFVLFTLYFLTTIVGMDLNENYLQLLIIIIAVLLLTLMIAAIVFYSKR